MPPTISVILSARNSEVYIRECIDSILQQTYGDFDLIAFDDRSTDSTLEKLGSRAEYLGAKTGPITPTLDDAKIKTGMLLASQIIHSSVMIRREVLTQHNIQCNPDFKGSQDYCLWVDLIGHIEF